MRILLTLLLALAVTDAARGATNLLANGSFDDKSNPLTNWKVKYDKEGESWYFQNHEHVKVEPSVAGHSGVLALWGDKVILFDIGQGTKVDSFPVPVKPGSRYKVTLSARSTGPAMRALVEGYQWRPGVKPHPHPDLSELRKCYKSELLYFGSQKGGGIANVDSQWKTTEITVPPETKTDLQKGILSKMEFAVIHIVAIGGTEGTLYIDDVKLEPTGK